MNFFEKESFGIKSGYDELIAFLTSCEKKIQDKTLRCRKNIKKDFLRFLLDSQARLFESAKKAVEISYSEFPEQALPIARDIFEWMILLIYMQQMSTRPDYDRLLWRYFSQQEVIASHQSFNLPDRYWWSDIPSMGPSRMCEITSRFDHDLPLIIPMLNNEYMIAYKKVQENSAFSPDTGRNALLFLIMLTMEKAVEKILFILQLNDKKLITAIHVYVIRYYNLSRRGDI